MIQNKNHNRIKYKKNNNIQIKTLKMKIQKLFNKNKLLINQQFKSRKNLLKINKAFKFNRKKLIRLKFPIKAINRNQKMWFMRKKLNNLIFKLSRNLFIDKNKLMINN